MTVLVITLVVFLLSGIAANVLLRRAPATQGRLAEGLVQLARLRWREFTRLVLQAMQARGYRVLKDDHSAGDELAGEGGDILLERDGQRVLLLCKYGNASVVGAQSVLGLGRAAELRGAHAAMVVTPGRFDAEARRVAAQQHVELIDGASLWPEVQPFLGEEFAAVAAPSKPERRNVVLAWVGAAAVAVITWSVLHAMLPKTPDSSASPEARAQVIAPVVATPVAVAPPAQRPAPRPPESRAAPAAEAIPTDPAMLTRRRSETANAISTLEGVNRAVWATQSTLLVYLATEDADPSVRLCPLLERYPELAASRVQLQPPNDSLRTVRFRQCKAY